MKKKILFRADGNSNTGLGHLYRLFALVEMYKAKYDFMFLTREDSVLNVIPKEYTVKIIPNTVTIKEEPNWLANYFIPENHILIADGYQFTSFYQKLIKETGFFLVYIDDLTTEYMYADVVVNHSPHVIKEDFKSENYTQFALGTKYAMLRPLFNKAANKKRDIVEIQNAFVCFGGADPYDLSLKATQALLQVNVKKIHVVLGGAYVHSKIVSLAEENNTLFLHENLNEMELYSLMESCQMAIVPASTILYEICSVKMPVLCGYYVDNQELIYKGFVENNAVFKGGDFSNYTSLDFEKEINSIISLNCYTEYIQKQSIMFDSGNKDHFLKILNKK